MFDVGQTWVSGIETRNCDGTKRDVYADLMATSQYVLFYFGKTESSTHANLERPFIAFTQAPPVFVVPSSTAPTVPSQNTSMSCPAQQSAPIKDPVTNISLDKGIDPPTPPRSFT